MLTVLENFFWHISGVCKKGDGIGGEEKLLGKANTMEECIDKVKEANPDANGATMVHPCSGM